MKRLVILHVKSMLVSRARWRKQLLLQILHDRNEPPHLKKQYKIKCRLRDRTKVLLFKFKKQNVSKSVGRQLLVRTHKNLWVFDIDSNPHSGHPNDTPEEIAQSKTSSRDPKEGTGFSTELSCKPHQVQEDSRPLKEGREKV
jgi:hypothetical protein